MVVCGLKNGVYIKDRNFYFEFKITCKNCYAHDKENNLHHPRRACHNWHP